MGLASLVLVGRSKLLGMWQGIAGCGAMSRKVVEGSEEWEKWRRDEN